jgi:anti-sigma factor (TIGR02949 family)
MSGRESLTCHETFERIDDYLDRELSGEEMELVRTHVKACEVCAKVFHFEGAVVSAVREKLESVSLPDGLKQKVLTSLQALQAERDG